MLYYNMSSNALTKLGNKATIWAIEICNLMTGSKI